MAYLNNSRDNRIGPNGELWENDNRVETRYLWNGAFLDLCDLPPKEYMKTIFVTNCSGGGSIEGGGSDETIGKNKIKIVQPKGEGRVSVMAIAEKPVEKDTDVITYVNTSSQGKIKVVLTITKGHKESQIEDVFFTTEELVPRVEEVEMPNGDVVEDNNYVEKPVVGTSLYSITGFNGEIEKMHPQEVIKESRKNTIEMNTEVESKKFTTNLKPVIDIDFDSLPSTNLEDAISKYSSDVYFLTDKEVDEIYAGDRAFVDTPNWVELEPIIEPSTGIKYHVWMRRDNISGAQLMENGKEDKNWDIIVSYK